MIGKGVDFGRQSVGAGRKINVEYVSANPTGPMHVGHCRGAVVGDTLANMLEFVGYDVVKEYYINDAGAQIDVLGRSAFLRYREALGDDIGEIPAGLYPGDYLVRVGQALAQQFGRTLLQMPEEDALGIVKDRTIDAMMVMIREDLALLNVHHEVFFSERTLHADNANAIRSAINALTLAGHVYKGTLPPPKGQKPEDWEDREQSFSGRPPWATTWTGRWSSRMARSLISPPTLPICTTSLAVASTRPCLCLAPTMAATSSAWRRSRAPFPAAS